MSAYDPNSDNAMFGKILTKLEELEEGQRQLLAQTSRANDRITLLEHFASNTKATVAAVSATVSALVAVTREFLGKR